MDVEKNYECVVKCILEVIEDDLYLGYLDLFVWVLDLYFSFFLCDVLEDFEI